MFRKSTFLLVALALWAMGWHSLLADSAIDRYAEAEMARNAIPGLAIAVVESRRVVHLRTYGVRSIESSVPLSLGDPIELASLSKSFTALALVQLEREGLLARDEAVTAVISELDSRRWQAVTLHDLLRHRSGLRRQHDFLAPCCEASSGTPDPDESIKHLAEAELESLPGEVYSYANSNYVLLAAAVQRAAGTHFADYLRRRVFRPLGLRRTTLDPTEALSWGAAVPHEWLWGQVRPSPSRFLGWPGSSLVKSSATDMGAYVAKLLDPSLGGLASSLSTEPWWDQLRTEYDLGWAISSEAGWIDGELVLEHTGKVWGGQTAVVLVPNRGAGVAVLMNLGTDGPIRIARQILLSRLRSEKLRAVRASSLDRPDTWAMVFLAVATALFGVALWYGWRAVFQLRTGRRAWQPTALGVARAALLGIMASVLVASFIRWPGPPLAALPSTVGFALPWLVATVAVLLAVVGGTALIPRVPSVRLPTWRHSKPDADTR